MIDMQKIYSIWEFLSIRQTSDERYSIETKDRQYIFYSNLKFEDFEMFKNMMIEHFSKNSLDKYQVAIEKDWINALHSLLKKEIDLVLNQYSNRFESSSDILNDIDFELNDYESESFNNYENEFEDKVFSLEEINEIWMKKILWQIEIVHKERDVRNQWHWVYQWKSVVKWNTEEEVREQIQMIEDSLKEMLENWEIVSLIFSKHESNNCFWISNSRETLEDLLFNWNKDYSISSNNLVEFFKKPNFVRTAYTLNKEHYDKIIEKLKEQFYDNELKKKENEFNARKLFVNYIRNNRIDKIKFSQDSYFKEIRDWYNKMIDEYIKSWYTSWIKWIKNQRIELWIKWDEIHIQDWTHRVLALIDSYNKIIDWHFSDYKKRIETVLEDIEKWLYNVNLVDFNLWIFSMNELEIEDIKNVDSIDNSELKKYMK